MLWRDFLTHGFNAKAAASLGVEPSSPAVDDMAARFESLGDQIDARIRAVLEPRQEQEKQKGGGKK